MVETQVGPVDEKPKQENQYLGETLTPEGWKELRWRENKEVVVDPLDAIPVDEALKPIHKKFREKHRHALNLFFSAINQFKELDRKVPALREELITKLKFEKQIIKDLCDFGLLKQEVIPIEMKKVKLGGRAVIVPTIEARKLMRSIERALLGVIDGAKSNISGEGDQGSSNTTERGTTEGFIACEIPGGIDRSQNVY